jgi:PAS domain S-box-containing protein
MKIEKSEKPAKTENLSPDCDVMIGFRMDGVIFHWNDMAERIFGYPAIEAVGQDMSIIFPKNYFKEPKAFIAEMEGKLEYETLCKTKSGDRINLLFHAFPVKDDMGTVQGVSLSAKDITELKRAEEKQAMLASIVSSSDDGIISKTLKGIITSWNQAATNIFGYTEEEAIGQHISIIIPPESLEEEELIIDSIRRGEKIDHFETIRISKDGTEKNVSLTVSPVRNKKGQIIGASKIVRDISDQVIDEVRLARLASIVTSSDDAIISKTLDGIITSWNRAATRMFGYSESEVIGKHITIIIPPDRLDEEANIIDNIRRGQKIDHFETIRVAKDGSQKHISLTVSPLRNSKGRIIGASKIARDISVRVEAENKQKLYTQRLMDLNDYKDEFMVMASHELKTPLTVILANLQILQDMMNEDPRVSFISKTINQVNKLNDLIYNLFDVSKIQAGQLKYQFSHFDLNQLIREIIEHTFNTTSHSLHFNSTNENFWINADKERIEQVIVNILSNAIKYSPKNGDIILNLKRENKNIVVSISDKGIGIPESDLENIFLRFYRVSGSASSFSGSGIGLYISAEIIKSHGGKIWTESKLGEGSVFHFSIPAAD